MQRLLLSPRSKAYHGQLEQRQTFLQILANSKYYLLCDYNAAYLGEKTKHIQT